MRLNQMKNFCTAKEIINQMKRQPTTWKKIFSNHIPEKGQYQKYTKNPYNEQQKTKQAS